MKLFLFYFFFFIFFFFYLFNLFKIILISVHFDSIVPVPLYLGLSLSLYTCSYICNVPNIMQTKIPVWLKVNLGTQQKKF